MPPHPRRVRGPSAIIFASAGDVMPPPPQPPSLMAPSLVTTNDISSTAAAAIVAWNQQTLQVMSVDFIILMLVPSLYSSSDWQLRVTLTTGCPTIRELVRSPRLHAVAFYGRLAGSSLRWVALSCTHCDVYIVNQTLQVRRIGCRSAVALHLRCYKLPLMCRCPTSLSV